MSYAVTLFHAETRAAFERAPKAKRKRFFEDAAVLTPLTKSQRKALASHLRLVGVGAPKKRAQGETFVHEDWGAEATLTEHGLTLSAALGGEGVFEIGMLAAEVAGGLVEDLAKFDPQAGGFTDE